MLKPNRTVGAMLHQDHVDIERTFDGLESAAAAGADARTISALWDRFEHSLLDHFAVEEKDLFPLVEASHPEEVRALLADHQSIRNQLQDLDLAVDLHLIRAPAIQQLLAQVRAHAAREDGLLYQWVEEEATPGMKRAVLRRLERRVRRRQPRARLRQAMNAWQHAAGLLTTLLTPTTSRS